LSVLELTHDPVAVEVGFPTPVVGLKVTHRIQLSVAVGASAETAAHGRTRLATPILELAADDDDMGALEIAQVLGADHVEVPMIVRVSLPAQLVGCCRLRLSRVRSAMDQRMVQCPALKFGHHAGGAAGPRNLAQEANQREDDYRESHEGSRVRSRCNRDRFEVTIL
jgi:hypothetical protein